MDSLASSGLEDLGPPNATDLSDLAERANVIENRLNGSDSGSGAINQLLRPYHFALEAFDSTLGFIQSSANDIRDRTLDGAPGCRYTAG
jgi:hypothetical protein